MNIILRTKGPFKEACVCIVKKDLKQDNRKLCNSKVIF